MINKPAHSRQKVDLKGMKVTITDDTQDFQYATVEGMGYSQTVQVFSPYGLCSNPPDNSLAVVFNIQGIASNKVAIVDAPKRRKNGLSKGEVALFDYIAGSVVYLKENGGIDIETTSGSKIQLLPDGTITLTGDTAITGGVTINGNLTVTGTITGSDVVTSTVASYNAHTHSGVTTGSGNTGGPA